MAIINIRITTQAFPEIAERIRKRVEQLATATVKAIAKVNNVGEFNISCTNEYDTPKEPTEPLNSIDTALHTQGEDKT